MTNEIREEKINRKKKIQSVTTNEIREEKITKKKTTRQPNSTQPKYVWVHEFLRSIWVVNLPTRSVWIGLKKCMNPPNSTHEHP